MGEDVIYSARKSGPRLLVSLAVGVALFFAVFVLAPSLLNNAFVVFGMLGAVFGVLLLILYAEWRKGKNLVRGHIDNVPIADLTAAISWLSAISIGRRITMIGPSDGWVKVGGVA